MIDHLIFLLTPILKLHLKLLVTESTVLLIAGNLYGATILHLQYCYNQGVSFSLSEIPSAEQKLKLPVAAKSILFADAMVYDAAVDQIGFKGIEENKLIVSKGNNDYYPRYGYVFVFTIQ